MFFPTKFSAVIHEVLLASIYRSTCYNVVHICRRELHMHLSLLLPNFFPVQSMFTVNSAAVYCTVLCVPQRHIVVLLSMLYMHYIHTFPLSFLGGSREANSLRKFLHVKGLFTLYSAYFPRKSVDIMKCEILAVSSNVSFVLGDD